MHYVVVFRNVSYIDVKIAKWVQLLYTADVNSDRNVWPSKDVCHAAGIGLGDPN